MPHAEALINGFETDAVLGDKAYDAEAPRDTIEQMDAQAVIPPKSNRNDP